MPLEHQRARRVEAIERFVENDQQRVAHQGQEHRKLLTRAERQRIDKSFEVRREAQLVGQGQQIIADHTEALCRGMHFQALTRGQECRQDIGRAPVPELPLGLERSSAQRMTGD